MIFAGKHDGNTKPTRVLQHFQHYERRVSPSRVIPYLNWLVADLPPWKIWKSGEIIIPKIWKKTIETTNQNELEFVIDYNPRYINILVSITPEQIKSPTIITISPSA